MKVSQLCCIIVAAALLRGGVGHAAPATTKNDNKAPLQQAITSLLKEYQDAASGKKKESKGGGLREKSDFFGKEKPAGVTAEAVLAALERSTSSDPRADAYVKWQLLSAFDGKFDDKLTPRALRVYRAAPLPPPHPGLNRSELSRMLMRIGINNKEAEADLNAQYQNVVAEYRMNIEPYLAYRDELYSRFTPSRDTLLAGIADLSDRASRGAPANEFWTTIAAGIRSWGLDMKQAAPLRELAGAVHHVLGVIREERNKPFGKVMWVQDAKFRGLKWMPEATVSADKSIDETATWLEERAANPSGGGGGLGFKLEEKKPQK